MSSENNKLKEIAASLMLFVKVPYYELKYFNGFSIKSSNVIQKSVIRAWFHFRGNSMLFVN